MKKIIKDEELYAKMLEAISLLCDTVKTTLGPKGCNAIIDHSTFRPFITNDGVTIALNIESEDAAVNTILELAKESAINTNNNVGDGTTTTLVLLESIFTNGLKLIKEGMNPILLKKELNKYLEEIIIKIKEEKIKPSKRKLKQIACISGGAKEIGEKVSEAYFKVLNKEAIFLKEGKEVDTIVNFLKGYTFESNLASPYFLKSQDRLEFNEPLFLLLDKEISDIEEVSFILNIIIDNKRPLIILANNYSDLFIQNILTLNEEANTSIILLKTPYYGLNSAYLLDDIKASTEAKIEKDIVSDYNVLGKAKHITIDDKIVNISFEKNSLVTKRIEELKKSSLEDKNKRIAMFKNGSAEILVGGLTETERREKLMRYEDALWAISEGSKGIVPGSGLILSKISHSLSNKGVENIYKEALLKPLEQILLNAGLEYDKIYEEIKKKDFKVLYNVSLDKEERVENTLVYDPLSVLINSLTNAVSIASMLLTTTSLIINEYQNNLNKNNPYLEEL